jgi:hypothetical protein
MEIITLLSGIFMVPFFVYLPLDDEGGKIKLLSVIFAAGGMILTATAHITNLVVTNRLIKDGINVPDFLQIGKWPSLEMTIDYLAWGLFIGLAFIFSSMAKTSHKNYKSLRSTLLICGLLCLNGFIGSITINENLWYIAPLGYGIGTAIICIKLFTSKNEIFPKEG